MVGFLVPPIVFEAREEKKEKRERERRQRRERRERREASPFEASFLEASLFEAR